MTNDPWYYPLINQLIQIYNDIIIIYDPDNLGSLGEIVSTLSKDYILHYYENELGLRSAISSFKGKKILVFISDERLCVPYDVESRAEKITNNWSLKIIFPKLHIEVIKEYPTRLQEIYTEYKSIEGSLKTANLDETRSLVRLWIKDDIDCKEISDLVSSIKQFLNCEDPRWDAIAPLWGRLSYLKDNCSGKVFEYEVLDKEIIQKFEYFIFNRYSDLFYATSHNRPNTVNKIMEYLGYLQSEKLLLLCFDGMSFQEWNILKKKLEKHGINKFREGTIFALLPTLTKISRRSIFSGERDYQNPIDEDKGFVKYIRKHWNCEESKQIGFFYNAGQEWNPEYLNYEYIGIIINLFDDTAHSTKNVDKSKLLMQKNLINILQETQIEELFHKFLKAGYRIFITSDHGTVWCLGNGYKVEKYLVEERAKRALLYPNKTLADDFADKKRVKLFRNTNLLGEKILIFPQGREMFAAEKEVAISHGGIHLEEVIVPFIEVLP